MISLFSPTKPASKAASQPGRQAACGPKGPDRQGQEKLSLLPKMIGVYVAVWKTVIWIEIRKVTLALGRVKCQDTHESDTQGQCDLFQGSYK